MPMPSATAQELNESISTELMRLAPPFYGVNVITLGDLELFTLRMAPVRERFGAFKGFTPHFRAMTDYGAQKRLLSVNLYGPEFDQAELKRVLEDPEYVDEFVATLEVVDGWDFFTARDF